MGMPSDERCPVNYICFKLETCRRLYRGFMTKYQARFRVSDPETFAMIRGAGSIASFEIRTRPETMFRDTYLDTLDLAIYSSGYSFRCREQNETLTYTLTPLENTGILVHRKITEYSFPEGQGTGQGEATRLEHLILEMIGTGKLFLLFEVCCNTMSGEVITHSRKVAELVFNDAVITSDGKAKACREVEVGHLDGEQVELQVIVSALGNEYGLSCESKSLFDTGFGLLMENMRREAKRAGYKPLPPAGRVRFLPLNDLFGKYGIERNHARKVAENSLILFDRLRSVHGLGEHLRNTMKIAALVHDIGVMEDLKDHHKKGRDILLTHPPSELPAPLHLMLPWTTFLHKKKITGKKLEKLGKRPYFAALPPGMRDDVLKLAALLRLADGLDYSRTDSRIGDLDFRPDSVVVGVSGEGAEIDANRADTKADLWRMLFDRDIVFRVADLPCGISCPQERCFPVFHMQGKCP
jgi:exopolyphosphatase/guanosine-5'-triphosphate,3'-diphosphate pyrophosphatase